jgi:hypothetical protein
MSPPVWQLFCSDWAASYGHPYLEHPAALSDVDIAPVVEDGGVLRARDVPAAAGMGLVFVDGVRRMESHLTLEGRGAVTRGVTGAHGVGAVVCRVGSTPCWESCTATRYIVWEGGEAIELPPHRGFSWRLDSLPPGSKATAEDRLQNLMRDAERDLAEDLAGEGRVVVLDGPLTRVRTQGKRVLGYVKTQWRIPLDDSGRAVVAALSPGQRTSLLAPRDDVYTTYLRLPTSGPAGMWGATVRLEIPTHAGVARASEWADTAAALLPRYAGIAHIDPRAPQNLQPVAALERHLRHLLGDAGLATRAVRTVIANGSARASTEGAPL